MRLGLQDRNFCLPVLRGTRCLSSYFIQNHQEGLFLLVYAIGFSISIVLYPSSHCLWATQKLWSSGWFLDHLQLRCVPCPSSLLLAGGSCVWEQGNITDSLGSTGHPCSFCLFRLCLWPTWSTGNEVNVLEVHLNRLCRCAVIWWLVRGGSCASSWIEFHNFFLLFFLGSPRRKRRKGNTRRQGIPAAC